MRLPDAMNMRFGGAVRAWRRSVRQSQAELAAPLGILFERPFTAMQVHNLEVGGRKTSIGEAMLIAHLFGKSVDELLGGVSA